MSDIQNKLVEIITQLHASAPDAANMAFLTIRMDAIQKIGFSILCFILVGLFCWWVNKTSKRLQEKLESFDDHPFLLMLAISGSVLGALFVVVSFLTLFDIWTWIGVFDPKLYLAHHVITKLGG